MKIQKPKLLVTFSGGRSSGVMAHHIKTNLSNQFDLCFVFANTGQENDETLDFVHQCDKAFDLGVVWVEADVHHGERKASTHKIVNYETATRRSEFFDSPYTEVVKKYGVPNKAYMHCTRELKENPIHDYIQNVKGWKKGTYQTAIGIRSDEPKRLKRNDHWQNKIYLADFMELDQQGVWDFWKGQPFDLAIEDYQGNCAWCFKKCEKKLKRILKDDPSIFDYPDFLEKKFGTVGKNKIKGEHVKEPRTLYRNYKTAAILIAEVIEPHTPNQKEGLYQ